MIWISKYVKCVVHVKFDVIVDWGVGAGVGRVVGIGYGEWFELEVGYEVDTGDDRSFNKGVNM